MVDAIAVGYVFDTDVADGSWLAFDDALAPLGYADLLIHGGPGTGASCMFAGFKREAEDVARTVEALREWVGLRMENARPFGVSPSSGVPRSATQGDHVLIGEHAQSRA